MKTHTLTQGSPEWLAYRSQMDNASDAPAMMGCSPYKSRDKLLQERATGITAEVDSGTQFLFDQGHRFEAKARPLAEEIIGEELFPVVGSNGNLSASFDGLTMDESIAFEHKSLNAEMATVMAPENATGADLPLHYRVQMEQQCMVAGCKRVLFIASKWKGDELVDMCHVWYDSDPTLAEQIRRGWEQFHADLANYQATATVAKAAGRAPTSLPALRIELSGEVRASNLSEFRDQAMSVFAGINRELKTDTDFADAEQTVKWCADVEQRLEAAKQNALSQTATIDALFRTIDDISAEARRVRLELDKLVKGRKEAIKLEIVNAARAEFTTHVGKLNHRLGRALMPMIPAAFGEAIKGKRTVDSIQSAVNDELARVKIEASAIADRIDGNLKLLKGEGHDWSFLFPDLEAVCNKEGEDFARLLAERQRVHQAKMDEAAKPIPAPAPAPAPTPVVVAAPVISAPVNHAAQPSTMAATLRIADISARLGFTVTADLLEGLGAKPTIDGPAKRYSEAQFQAICQGLVSRILGAAKAHQLGEAA
jgi:putative phage-type endonuclease